MNNSGWQINFMLLPNVLVWIGIINIQKLVTHVTHCLFGVHSIYASAIRWRREVSKRRVSPGHAQSGWTPEFGYGTLYLKTVPHLYLVESRATGKKVQRFSRAGPRGRGREWATLGEHPLSWLLSNNRLEEVCSTLTMGTFSSRLLLSNQDKGCTPSVAHSLPLPLGPTLLNLSSVLLKDATCTVTAF